MSHFLKGEILHEASDGKCHFRGGLEGGGGGGDAHLAGRSLIELNKGIT